MTRPRKNRVSLELTSISLAMTNLCDISTIPAKVVYGECPEIIGHFVWRELNFGSYQMTHIPVIFHSKKQVENAHSALLINCKYETPHC
jgi:hypothetical protein